MKGIYAYMDVYRSRHICMYVIIYAYMRAYLGHICIYESISQCISACVSSYMHICKHMWECIWNHIWELAFGVIVRWLQAIGVKIKGAGRGGERMGKWCGGESPYGANISFK